MSCIKVGNESIIALLKTFATQTCEFYDEHEIYPDLDLPSLEAILKEKLKGYLACNNGFNTMEIDKLNTALLNIIRETDNLGFDFTDQEGKVLINGRRILE